MTADQCKDATAVLYGFKDFKDYFINGDVTESFIDDVMELYGNYREYKSSNPIEVKVKLKTEFNPN